MTNARRSHARRTPRPWGALRQLPSGNWQASYTADGKRHTAPVTFRTRGGADAWLAQQRAALETGTHRDPAAGADTLADYADRWLAERELRPRTLDGYRRLLDQHLLPALGPLALRSVTPAAVRSWYATLNPATPAVRAQAYGLLRAIMRQAADDDLIAASPVHIRGAGANRRASRTEPATLAEIETISAAMPPRLRTMILLAAWCGLRYGECVELRRADVDLDAGVVRVRRAASRVPGRWVVGPPKTTAGIRGVAVPPHVRPALAAHLAGRTGPEPGALLFPGEHGGHLSPATFYGWYYPARDAAGRPDLRFHDLRHTAAVLAASTGASLAEIMARLGHASAAAAMRYQHAAAGRDEAIADSLSGLADGTVIPLHSRRPAQ